MVPFILDTGQDGGTAIELGRQSVWSGGSLGPAVADGFVLQENAGVYIGTRSRVGRSPCLASALSSIRKVAAVERVVQTFVTPVRGFTISRLTTIRICNKNDSHYELCRPTP